MDSASCPCSPRQACGAWSRHFLAVLGVALFAYARRSARRPIWAIATVGAAIVVVGMIACPGPTAVWRHGAVGAGRLAQMGILADRQRPARLGKTRSARSVLWEADGVESSIAIVGSDGLAFHVNGMCDGNAIEDVGTQVMLGLIGGGARIRSRRPRWLSAWERGRRPVGWQTFRRSSASMSSSWSRPSGKWPAAAATVNRDVLANPKLRLIFNDAREVLLTTAGRYDLMVCEPSNPYRSGIANLFTREFYRAGRDRLNDGGMFVQWVQAYEIDQRTMRTIFATFRSVFPRVEVWQTKLGDLLLVGSQQRPAYSVPALQSTLAAEPFASALHCAWHTTGLEGLFSHYIGGSALVDHFIGPVYPRAGDSGAINSDDHNAIEYGFAGTLGHTDWDATGALFRQSVEIGDHRPAVNGGAVDWKAVALARQWDAAVGHYGLMVGGKKLSADDLTLNEGADDEVLKRYIAKDAWGMLAAWESLPHSAPCLTELAMIAHLYAESGSSKALPLIEQLRHHLPTEAAAL